MSNIYNWEKLTFSKLVRKVNFLERKFEEMHKLWRAKRYKVYSGKCLFWHYCLQVSFIYKSVSQVSLNLFCSGDKRLLSETLGNVVDFTDIMNVFPNILENFKNLTQGFVDEIAMMTMTLTSSCYWKKTLVPFFLQKKRLEKTF